MHFRKEKGRQNIISLEDSFLVYEQGMKLIKECNDKIDRVEKKVLELNAEGVLEEME